jgi:hypothetical protein
MSRAVNLKCSSMEAARATLVRYDDRLMCAEALKRSQYRRTISMAQDLTTKNIVGFMPASLCDISQM